MFDTDGNIANMNRFAAELFRIDRETWLGRSATELFPDFDTSLLEKTLTERVPIPIDELPFQSDNGKILLSGEVVSLTVLGQSVGTVLTFQERIRANRIPEELVRAEKLAVIGCMAAGTVHEIRNPLTTVKGFLQLFEKDMQKLSGMGLVQRSFSDKFLHVFPLLFSEIQKIEQILSDFLLLGTSREIRFKVLRVNDLFNAVLPKLQELALLHDIGIVCELPRENARFFGDLEGLTSALFNLIRNSFEAMNGNVGEIRLSVRIFDDCLRLSVRDNGPGIPKDLISSVFDPFVTTKPDRPGLGLSICRQVLTRMGGDVTISSEPGKGTTVQLEIPLLREDALSADDLRAGPVSG